MTMTMTRVGLCRESSGSEGRSAHEMPYLAWGAKIPLALRAVNGYSKPISGGKKRSKTGIAIVLVIVIDAHALGTNDDGDDE